MTRTERLAHVVLREFGDADRYIEEWGHEEAPLRGVQLVTVALRVAWSYRVHKRMGMGMKSTNIGRVIGIGLGSSAIALLAGAFVAPVAVIGLLGIGVTFFVVAILRARTHGSGWWAVWTVAIATIVWVAASLLSFTYWGTGFRIADAGGTIPSGLQAMTLGAFLLGLLAFVSMVTVGIIAAARRPIIE